MTVRANLGCGSIQPAGWANIDKEHYGQEFLADVRIGLPFDTDHFDYIVANHLLSDFDHHELSRVLVEIRRVLKPGGIFRVLVPNLIAAIHAWHNRYPEWFPQGDDLTDIDERFCTYVTWFGESKSVFTSNYLCLLLTRAGFRIPITMPAGASHHGPIDITSLDDRIGEAIVMEAVK